MRLQKFPKRRARKQHRIIPPHGFYGNLAPQEIRPVVGKFLALLRLHGMDETRVALQENARVVVALFKRKPGPVVAKTRMSLNEILFAQTQKCRELSRIITDEPDLTRPAATGSASLALKVEFHVDGMCLSIGRYGNQINRSIQRQIHFGE